MLSLSRGAVLGLYLSLASPGVAFSKTSDLLVPQDYATVQAAIDVSQDGDRVLIEPGLYSESLVIPAHSLTLRTTERGEPTVIQGDGTQPTIEAVNINPLLTLDLTIVGLTLTGGGGTFGGGLRGVNGTFELTGCTVRSNAVAGIGSAGGGVVVSSSSLRMESCDLVDNQAALGPGLYASDSGVTLQGCTLAGNEGSVYTCEFGGSSTLSVRGSILWNETDGELGLEIAPQASVVNSIVRGGYIGPSNFSADPLFEDPAGGNYALLLGSPAQDAGDPFFNSSVDIEGNPRFLQGGPDVGAHESDFPAFFDYCLGVDCPCGNDSIYAPDFPIPAGCANSALSSGAYLRATGSGTVTAGDTQLQALLIPLGAPLLPYAGTTAISTPFGDGFRCVGGAVHRFPIQISEASNNVITDLDSSVSTVPITLYYQVWYRDQNGPCAGGFNFSNAVGINWRL